jgi:hypothetical protein
LETGSARNVDRAVAGNVASWPKFRSQFSKEADFLLLISCKSTPKAFGTEIIAQLILIPKREVTIFLFFLFLGQAGPKNLEKSWQQLVPQGRLLKEVCNDPRIKGVWLEVNAGNQLPQIVLENIWAERFLVDYVQLPNGALAAHANQI